MQRLTATLPKQFSESEELEKTIRENWRNHGLKETFSHLTRTLSEARLSVVFTPRWISRKASSGVLFFWGGEHAS